MPDYYWNLESWGNGYPPENADEIISAANEMIERYAETHSEVSTDNYSEKLWEYYCSHDALPAE